MRVATIILVTVLASVGFTYGKRPSGTFGADQIDEAKAEAMLDGKPVAYLLTDSTTS